MSIAKFLKSTKAEMEHVTWPKRREVVIATITVIVVSALLGYFLGAFDFLFSRGLNEIIKL